VNAAWALLVAALAAGDPAPGVPAETATLSEGHRAVERIVDWAERAGAVALEGRAPAMDAALLADLGLDRAALPPDRLLSEVRRRALDLAWRVIEHPDCPAIFRARAEKRIRALLDLVPPNRDVEAAAPYRALVVVARAAEWTDPATREAKRTRFSDSEIARLRRDLAESEKRVFEWTRGTLKLESTVRVLDEEPFRAFARASSREYGRTGVVPDLDGAGAFLEPARAVRDGYHGVFLYVKYAGTVAGRPIPSPSDGLGGAMRVVAERGGEGVKHLAWGTLHYRSSAGAWFGRTGFLHEWYHGLHDLASLAAPRGTRLPDNHSIWLHGSADREDRLLDEDDPDFYRVILGRHFPPRLLRAAVGDL